MLRLLIRPRWLAMLALAVLWALICLVAMQWQWGRYEERSVLAQAITAHYAAPAVALTTVLPSTGTMLAPDQAWTRVEVTGEYDAARTFLVRNRTQSAGVGMEVLVPLRTPGGVLVVDRGWVENARTAADIPQFPAAPSGQVTVTGWLLAGEGASDEGLPAGQLSSVDTASVAAAVGDPTYHPYLVLGEEAPSAARPAPLDEPVPDLGPHQGYAIQWAVFSVFGFVFVFIGIRNEAATARSGAGTALEPAAAKPKKVRIWDEEDW